METDEKVVETEEVKPETEEVNPETPVVEDSLGSEDEPNSSTPSRESVRVSESYSRNLIQLGLNS